MLWRHGPSVIVAQRDICEPLRSTAATSPDPFDIVGDVHGCCDELEELLVRCWATASTGRARGCAV